MKVLNISVFHVGVESTTVAFTVTLCVTTPRTPQVYRVEAKNIYIDLIANNLLIRKTAFSKKNIHIITTVLQVHFSYPSQT